MVVRPLPVLIFAILLFGVPRAPQAADIVLRLSGSEAVRFSARYELLLETGSTLVGSIEHSLPATYRFSGRALTVTVRKDGPAGILTARLYLGSTLASQASTTALDGRLTLSVAGNTAVGIRRADGI